MTSINDNGATPTSSIINLNNEGVSLLQQSHQHAAALDKFGRALDILREFLADDDSDEALSAADSSPISTTILSVPIKTDSSASLMIPKSFSNFNDDTVYSVASSPHNSFCFYERAFLLDPEDTTHISSITLTSVLLFNMGLSFHQRGLSCGGNSTFFLQKALGLYKMFAALTGSVASAQGNGNPHLLQQKHREYRTMISMRTILMALWNNMGHLYSHFFMYNEESECGRQLLHLLQQDLYSRYHQTDENNSITTREDKTVFLLNAVMISGSSAHRLAPAA
jgi:hypothetical protein